MQSLKCLMKSRFLLATLVVLMGVAPSRWAGAKVISDTGVAHQQNRGQQDAYQVIPQLDVGLGQPVSYFSVFDGHGTPRGKPKSDSFTHHYLTDHLHELLQKRVSANPELILDALTAAFLEADHTLCRAENLDGSGATASVLMVAANQLYAANVGDSPILLGYADGRIEQVSATHSAGVELEADRVKAMGGFICYLGGGAPYVMGMLQLSRALGDCTMKEVILDAALQPTELAQSRYYGTSEFDLNAVLAGQNHFLISPFPSVQAHPLSPDLQFAILATDGVIADAILDVTTAGGMVREARTSGRTAKQAADELLMAAVERDSGGDDKTAIVLYFGD